MSNMTPILEKAIKELTDTRRAFDFLMGRLARHRDTNTPVDYGDLLTTAMMIKNGIDPDADEIEIPEGELG